MPDTVRPMRITRISLRPHITIRGEVPIEKVERLVRVAHDECFIANSLSCDIDVLPSIVVTAAE
jgi:organic hydroperoxide reductase OsmC/OhrA